MLSQVCAYGSIPLWFFQKNVAYAVNSQREDSYPLNNPHDGWV